MIIMFPNYLRVGLIRPFFFLCLLKFISSQGVCKGLDKEKSTGTLCYTVDFEYCYSDFAIGTVVNYRCATWYKPRKVLDPDANLQTNSSKNSNAWKNVTCLAGHAWSSSHFSRGFSCERDGYQYCGSGWTKFFSYYDSIDDTVKIVVCTVGCLTNIINLMVFTRPKMRNPLNMVLASLAGTDFLFMASGLVEHSRKVHWRLNGDKGTLSKKVMEIHVHQILSFIFHMLSIFLTLLMAFLRYYGVLNPFRSRRFVTKGIVRWAIFLTIFLSMTILPIFIWGMRMTHVDADNKQSQSDIAKGNNTYSFVNATGVEDYDPGFIDNGNSNDTEDTSTTSARDRGPITQNISMLAQQIGVCTYAIIGKLLPCTILSILIVGLIRGLIAAARERNKLQEMDGEGNPGGNKPNGDDNRTTRMLIIMLIFFVLTELPDAIIATLVALLPRSISFTDECLLPTLNVVVLLEYLSCLSSFVFYLSMSMAYRTTLKEIIGTSARGVINIIRRRMTGD